MHVTMLHLVHLVNLQKRLVLRIQKERSVTSISTRFKMQLIAQNGPRTTIFGLVLDIQMKKTSILEFEKRMNLLVTS